MAEQGASSHDPAVSDHRLKRSVTASSGFLKTLPGKSGFKGCYRALALVGVTALAVWLLKPGYPRSSKVIHDPSAVIGTFVTVYGLLVGAFGVLAGFLVAKKVPKPSRWATLKSFALTLLAAATIADLILVLNAANDLFTAAAYGLTYPALHDTATDFKIYFSLSLFAGGVSLVIAALLAGLPGSDDSRPLLAQSTPAGPQVVSTESDHQDAAGPRTAQIHAVELSRFEQAR